MKALKRQQTAQEKEKGTDEDRPGMSFLWLVKLLSYLFDYQELYEENKGIATKKISRILIFEATL